MPEGQRAPAGEPPRLRNAYFDEEGRLYIADEALAREIQNQMNTTGRITMVRDRFAEEPRPPARSGSGEPLRPTTIAMTAASSSTSDPPAPGTGTEESDPKANLMCPCSPEPIP